MNYEWKPHHVQELGVSEAFKLVQKHAHGPYYIPDTLGYLKKGSKKRQGWFVHDFWTLAPITPLPHTLTENEAKDTAKLILLSLKQTGSEETS